MLSCIYLLSSQNYLLAGLRFIEPCLFQMNNAFPFIAVCWGGSVHSKGEETNQYPFHWMLIYLHFELFLPWKNDEIFSSFVCVCGIHPFKPPTGLTLLMEGFKAWQTQRAQSSPWPGSCVEYLSVQHLETSEEQKNQKREEKNPWTGWGAECWQISLPEW